MFKDRRFGSQSAWFHTGSNAIFAAADGLESSDKGLGESCAEDGGGEGEKSLTEEKTEEKPLRLHRRQKGSSSSASSSGGSSVMAESPDLLTIPGVGPRNLRKLVQKGIGGVAELKQLYKDKVVSFFHFHSFFE